MKTKLFVAIAILLISRPSISEDVDIKTNEAKEYGKTLCMALWLFKLDQRRYPTNEEGLFKLLEPKVNDTGASGEPYLEKVESDPWGNSYIYSKEGADFRLWSMGSDGMSNSKDDIGPNICEM